MERDPDYAEAKRAYWRLYQRDRSVSQSREPKPYLWLENRMGVALFVDAGPVRAAVLVSGVSVGEIAARLGRADESAVRHALRKDRIEAATAVAVLDAVGSSPVEAGI